MAHLLKEVNMRLLEYAKRSKAAPLLLSVPLLATAPALAQDKPNIVVIWGDDIGRSNLSTYT